MCNDGRSDRDLFLLVAAGSAMAAGCEPCLDQIIPNLIEAGVPDGDIRRAVEIGDQVREAAAEYMKEVADVLADTRLAQGAVPEKAPADSAAAPAGCCGPA